MSARVGRRTSMVRLIALVVLAGVVLGVAVTAASWQRADTDALESPASALPQSGETPASVQPAFESGVAEAVVDEDGFELELDGVVATGPPGIADVGTTVRMVRDEGLLPQGYDEFAALTGPGMRLTLGNGEQPRHPLELSFPVTVNDGETAFVLTGTQSDPQLLETTVDGNRLVTVTEHLSPFRPMLIRTVALERQMRTWALEALKLQFSAPACFGNEPANFVDRWTFADVDEQVVYPCLTGDDDDPLIQLSSNSPLVWRATLAPEGQPRMPTATSIAGTATAATWMRLQGSRPATTVVLPGERATFAPDLSTGEVIVSLELDPALSQVAVVAHGVSQFRPGAWLEGAEQAECFVGVADSVIGDGGSAAIARSTLECLGATARGAPGVLINLIASGPMLLAMELDGMVRSATARDQVTFTLSADWPAENERTTAPIDQADAQPFLGSWLGWVTQSNSPEGYSAAVELMFDQGQIVGTVHYRELGCTSDLHSAALDGGQLVMYETIVDDPQARCIDTPRLTFEPAGDGLAYFFDYNGWWTGEGHLTRP